MLFAVGVLMLFAVLLVWDRLGQPTRLHQVRKLLGLRRRNRR